MLWCDLVFYPAWRVVVFQNDWSIYCYLCLSIIVVAYGKILSRFGPKLVGLWQMRMLQNKIVKLINFTLHTIHPILPAISLCQMVGLYNFFSIMNLRCCLGFLVTFLKIDWRDRLTCGGASINCLWLKLLFLDKVRKINVVWGNRFWISLVVCFKVIISPICPDWSRHTVFDAWPWWGGILDLLVRRKLNTQLEETKGK